MIKISPRKIFKIPFGEGDESFSVTWHFPYSVDDKFKRLRDKELKDKHDDLLIECIIGWDGILDQETDAPVPITEDNKKAVYDLIRYDPEYMLNVMIAMLGAQGKNLNAGAMLQSIRNGELKDASIASEIADQPKPVST